MQKIWIEHNLFLTQPWYRSKPYSLRWTLGQQLNIRVIHSALKEHKKLFDLFINLIGALVQLYGDKGNRGGKPEHQSRQRGRVLLSLAKREWDRWCRRWGSKREERVTVTQGGKWDSSEKWDIEFKGLSHSRSWKSYWPSSGTQWMLNLLIVKSHWGIKRTLASVLVFVLQNKPLSTPPPRPALPPPNPPTAQILF